MSLVLWSRFSFTILIPLWYALNILAYSHELYRMLPIIRVGEYVGHSFFWLMDIITLIAVVSFLLMIKADYKNGDLRLFWTSAGILLIYPLMMIYASYIDLIN